MKGNKKVSPSLGVCGRLNAATKSKPISLTGIGFSQSVLRLLMVLLVLPMALVNAWAATTYMAIKTEDTNRGLVYMAYQSNWSLQNPPTSDPALSQYQQYYPTGSGSSTSVYISTGSHTGPNYNSYFWAKPARGWRFSTYSGYPTAPASSSYGYGEFNTEETRATWDGVKDLIQASNGGGADTRTMFTAKFASLTKYKVTYQVPVGGTYSVSYTYLKTRKRSDDTEYELYETGENYNFTSSSESAEVDSYETDEIVLTVPQETTNFMGWKVNGVIESTEKTYNYTVQSNATIVAEFKEIAWGNVYGDLKVDVVGNNDDLKAYSKAVYVPYTLLIGSWTESDYEITPMSSSNSFGSIAIGEIELDETNHWLKIPYTYTATDWGGIAVDVTVTPTPGAPVQFTILAAAERQVDYEACIFDGGETPAYTGTLAAMMTQANSMNNKPTLKLMQNKTITAPLSFTQSFTFDVNGKVLTANCASAFSIDAAGVDVKIIDGSFTQVGEIHTSHASSGNVNVVTFTKAAKLTMQGGTLSAENTGTGSAYGVDVQQGSIFYMTGGDLTVTASSGDAQGVHVATTGDYATFNGGSITVSAPTNAYGLWSAGQSNITNSPIFVETTTGANAYGAYINGGVSTITTTDVVVSAKTTSAYGANVNAGRLNFNGGKLDVSAVTSGVYGVHIASGATANMQQNTIVKAEATGASGTNVVGINNLGTASLNNITVTATSPTNYATAVNSITSAVSTTIEDGTYTANTETGYAYGLHHQYGALNVDGGTFKGIIKTSGSAAYGARAAVNATIANATLFGETRGTATTAYGFVGGVANQNITLTNCVITGKSITSKAYAIYSRTNVTATGCMLTATTLGTTDAYGFYAENGTNSLTNCNAAVTAQTTTAYGVYHKDGALTMNGGRFDVIAKQSGQNGAQTTVLYGLFNAASKTTNVANTIFTATAENNASSQYVYGAYINGTLNSTGGTYIALGRAYVYGIYGYTASTLNLANNTVTSTTTNGTYCRGIYAGKNFTIDGDIVNATGISTDVYALLFGTSSVGDVLGGKFSAQGNGTNGYGAVNATGVVGSVRLKGGVYKSSINLKKYAFTGYEVFNLDGSHPDYQAGYRYAIATENPSPYVCHIVNGAYYATLEEALQYTLDNSGSYTIVMTQSYTMPSGNYVLPANATLIIPYKFDQTTITSGQPKNPTLRNTVGLRETFLCLTMANGANLNVDGTIGVGGEMYCVETGRSAYNNSPFGRIHMETGSHIQLNSGAYLYAWGFITGTGTIAVKNNAEVHEMFQVGDMKSGSNIYNHYNGNSEKFFILNQYCIQNIEVPTTYYYNSRLIGAMRFFYNGSGGIWYGDDNIKLIGTSGALFEVTTEDESTWVRKSYDAVHDFQVWDINSKAQLGSISLTMQIPVAGNQQINFNSTNYILPVTSNMKMHILDGDFAITQNTELLPGAEIEIDKTASLTINSGKKLYVFDKDQWPLTTATCTPAYSLSWPSGSAPTRTVGDAAINVHGSIYANGAIYTTQSISDGTNATNGANIYSNNDDAGTVSCVTAAPSSTTSIELITGIADDAKVKKTVTMDPALLRNGDNSTTVTSGTAQDHAFAYMNDVWTETYKDECFETVGEHVYVKPADYVELKKQRDVIGDYDDLYIRDNHTYLSIDESRIFIHLLDAEGNCQWWEVEATSDPTVFECKKTGYEGSYYYDEQDGWTLKTVEVKFYAAETGDAVLKTITTDFNGIPDQAVIASNPTKATTAAATYQFYGWKSSVTGTEYPWTSTLEVATADMSYRPVFTVTPRHYTITLVDANNGANVPLEVAYGETPEYTPVKEPDAQYTYTFNGWNPSFTTVTGTATYTAQWGSTVNRYTVIWMNGESTIETDKNQAYGVTPTYNGATPTKDADNNFEYTFDGWSLTDGGERLTSLPAVSGDITYYAHFSTTPRYAITFANYDGTQLQKESVTQGEHPIYNGLTPGRARDLDGYFRFIGWKNSAGTDFAPNATLPIVTGKETYTAQYDYVNELYLITLNNIDGAGGSWSGKFGVGSTPFYNRDNNDVAVEPTKASTVQYEYTFSGWDPALVPVDGEATYTAQFEQHTRKYNITFANLDGNGASQTIEVEYGVVPVSPVTPIKEDGYKSYEFLGWNTTIVPVTADVTYTAQFSSTYTTRTFPISFDLDNGTLPTVIQVAYGETPEWTGETPTKTASAQYSYTFTGWYPAFSPVTGEESYIALYTQTLNNYTITFKNYDGSTIQSTQVSYGSMPTPPANPTRPMDVDNMKFYAFTGWDSQVVAVTADAVYTAQYSEEDIAATVTPAGGEPAFKSTWSEIFSSITDNCTVKLYADITNPTNNQSIDHNMTLDLNGHTISLTTGATSTTCLLYVDNKALTITDSQGGGMISCVGTGAASYLTIYVYGDNGSVTINGGTIQSNRTSSTGSSGGWNSTTYYSIPIYLNSDKSTLNLNGGELIALATSGNSVAVYHNVSSDWWSSSYYGKSYINGGKLKAATDIFANPQTSRVTLTGGYYSKDPGTNGSNITIPEGYEKQSISEGDYIWRVVKSNCTIIWKSEDGLSTLETDDNVSGGSAVEYNGEEPTKPVDAEYSYTFDGWSTVVGGNKVYEKDATIIAVDDAIYYAHFARTPLQPITFTNLDGNGAQQTVLSVMGTTPESPIFPEKVVGDDFYAFNHWEPTIGVVEGPATYTAVFDNEPSVRKYHITFDPANGEAKQEYDLVAGAEPAWSGENPAKEATAQYSYEFAGWDPAIVPVTAQVTYTAQYTPTVRSYTIRFEDYDGTELKSSTLEYGETPTPPSNPTRLDHMFTGWHPTIAPVTGAVTYTAQYVPYVATVTPDGGEPIYELTWSDVFADANSTNNCTIKLLTDITNPSNANNTAIIQNTTLDLNGHTISLTTSTTSNTRLLYVDNKALTIEDSQGGGMISYVGTGAASYLTIYVNGDNGSVTINGGTIQSNRTSSTGSSGGWNSTTYYSIPIYLNSDKSTLNLNGGELIALATSGNSVAVYHNASSSWYSTTYYGKSYINGGKLKAATNIFANPQTSRVTLSGGYYSKDPGSNVTLASGCEKRSMTDAEKAANPGYNYKVVHLYTVTFQNQGGTTLQNAITYAEGETPVYSGATPTIEPQSLYTFRAWKAEGDDTEYTTSFPPVTGNTTYVAQYDVVEEFDVTGDTPVENDAAVTTTTVHTDGTLNVANGVTLTTNNLILEASESASGQILETGTGTIAADNVYYDLKLNTDARHWHAFGVPWAVDIQTNPLVEVDNEGNVVRTLNISRDYEIMYYDGAERAANGPSADCWKYLRHYQEAGQPVEELVPGKGYMIAFGSHVNTVRFVKKSGAPIIYDGSVTVQAYDNNGEADPTNAGINAISNPMAYHANMTLSVHGEGGVGYVHDGGLIGEDEYNEVTIAGLNYIVGKTVYVQVDDEQTISVANSKISPAAAPARRAAKATDKKYMVLEDYYTVSFTSVNGGKVAKVYVLPEEDKEDAYVIGHDLVKMGMSDKKAQIWVKRYDVNLGLNTTAPINEVAEFPVNVYAPNAGEYTISLASQPDDEYTVYLTRNGEAIWNLSDAPYALSLPAGVDKTYGLRLSARKAPQTATDINEALIDAQGDTRKVLIDNKVFIIRGDKVYSVDGQLVK